MSEAHQTLKTRLDRAARGVARSREGLAPFALNRAYLKVLNRAFRDGLIAAPPVFSPSGGVKVILRSDEMMIDVSIEFT